MRPVKVEFQAFGPYAGFESVDFDAIRANGLFLICGKTGIGKTMILDAMTYALYGKSSTEGRDRLEDMRCTNAGYDVPTFVRFEFENNGEHYLFERRLERKRKNLSPSYNLMKKDSDGIWKAQLENPKEKLLNEEAIRIIGLDHSQFRQVVILPQGRFERFLISNSDEKEKILISLFGEEKWQKIAAYFYEEAEDRRNLLKETKDRIQRSLEDEDCENISQLEELIRSKENERADIDREYKEKDIEGLIKSSQEGLELAKSFKELKKNRERYTKLEEDKEKRTQWEGALSNAKRFENVRAFLDNETNAENELKKRKEKARKAAEAGKLKKDELVAAKTALERIIKKEEETEELKRKKILCEEMRRDYESLDTAGNELQKVKKVQKKLSEEETAARERLDAFALRIDALSNEYDALNAEHTALLDRYIKGITGELAGQLRPGKPCPVCGSTQHPDKACAASESVSKEEVDEKRSDADERYSELQQAMIEREEAKLFYDRKHDAAAKASADVKAAEDRLSELTARVDPDIPTLESLGKKIADTEKAIRRFLEEKERLVSEEKNAREGYTKALSEEESAKLEAKDAEKAYSEAKEKTAEALKENGFDTKEEALLVSMSEKDKDELRERINRFDTELNSIKIVVDELTRQLCGKEEPDEDECNKKLNEANRVSEEYLSIRAVLISEIQRLAKKLSDLRKEGEGIEERIHEADEDMVFAKKLRGDSGTGLQRYVLGIMFSSVVAAANKMLEMVHGGRYRLYRSDDRAAGSNKRGLELKVHDSLSDEHEGRSVGTLSGGEKFLASLALSVGMSTVARKNGIKTEALFIDEGFGSLDEDSINDAMNILKSIQKANGMVGIISHVRLLQDQIPTKLIVEETGNGSRIVSSIG